MNVKDEMIALLERRNELRARLLKLTKYQKDIENDKRALLIEIATTNNSLRDVEIDLSDIENEMETHP